ncbi:MAG TPA: S46 family peptidase [Bacteroidales bacterium]|nr:S46 family peptidase [Bacteroidales bacterium]
MKKLFIISVFCTMTALSAVAQEGMWLLSQLGQLDLAGKGLQIPVEKIYSPDKPCLANAILQLGGGSASFVSPEGLVVTNHHVAYRALQRASSVSSDYLTNGFLAKERSAEISAPGYQALIMLKMKDVTDEVLAAAKGITDPVEKDKKINEKIAAMTEAVKEKESDHMADVVSLFEGRQYIMHTYKVFKDIRIVYAPPLSIGNYGGEIDNWMWPRHTGDFSFMRVYVSPKGEGTEYSPGNVPYKPEVWLKVSQGDLDEGDFNFIIGYPGQTTRYRSSNSVGWNLQKNYPFSVSNFKEIIGLCEELTKDDPAGKLKVASLEKGLANVMKNYQGNIEGMTKTGFLQKKLDFEKEFLTWANSTPERKAKYADILAKEKAQYDILEKTRDRDNVIGILQGLSGTLSGVAAQIYGLAKELEKPEGERQPGLTKDALDEFAEGLTYTYNDYYEPVDKAMLLRALKMAEALPADQRIAGMEYIFTGSGMTPEQWVEKAYSTSKLKDIEFAKSLIGKPSSELVKLADPFIGIAAGIYDASVESAKISRVFGANVTALRKEYIEALYEWKGSALYPDASSTIRFTWGPIKGYKPADAVWYEPFTSLKGVVDKNTGTEPFDAPAGLVKLEEVKDYGRWSDPELTDVPVAFLNQCDITGGNSGSPVMNAKGEIIGIAFDGNWEAMTSDWQYDYAMQRCIAVDFRYVLFVTEKFGNAGFLLKEMGVL